MTQFTNVTSYLWVQNALSSCSLRECIKFVIILAKSPCQVCSEFPDVHNYIWLYICTGFVGLITAQVYLLPVHWVLFIAYKRCKVFKSCWTFWHCDLSAIYRTVYFIKPAHHKGLALVPVFNTLSDLCQIPDKVPKFTLLLCRFSVYLIELCISLLVLVVALLVWQNKSTRTANNFHLNGPVGPP